MSETRLEKYKKYRESLNEVKATNKTTEGAKNRDFNVVTDKRNTTSTLPLDEVLGQINEEDVVSNRLITKKRLQILLIAGIGAILLAGIIIFAVIAFGGK